MIRMTAEIEIYPKTCEILIDDTHDITITPAGNNISADIGDVVSMQRNGSNPFLLGVHKLSSGATYSNGEEYFIGSEDAENDGTFATPYVLIFDVSMRETALNNINFRIVFDTYNNAYPKNIQVRILAANVALETQNIKNNSSYFIFNSNYSFYIYPVIYKVEVTMSDWSMPGYPLRIQGIYTGLSIYADRRNLLSLSAPIKDRSDNEQPSYGIISNAGTLSLVDGTREIKEYARLGLLTTDLDVQLWLEDTLTIVNPETKETKKQSIGKFKTDKWSYDNINFEVTIDLKDDLPYLQNINAQSHPLNLNLTIRDLYDSLKNLIPDDYKFIGLDDSILYFLEQIPLVYFYWRKDSVWGLWNDFCLLTRSHMYENENREIIISSDFIG